MFMKPGKHHLFIGASKSLLKKFSMSELIRENEPVHYFYNRQMAMYRDEPVPTHVKHLKKSVLERSFRKDYSVFAKFHHDTTSRVIQCMDHDTRYWKVNRMVKDPQEYSQLCACIQAHYVRLKEIFTGLVVQG